MSKIAILIDVANTGLNSKSEADGLEMLATLTTEIRTYNSRDEYHNVTDYGTINLHNSDIIYEDFFDKYPANEYSRVLIGTNYFTTIDKVDGFDYVIAAKDNRIEGKVSSDIVVRSNAGDGCILDAYEIIKRTYDRDTNTFLLDLEQIDNYVLEMYVDATGYEVEQGLHFLDNDVIGDFNLEEE